MKPSATTANRDSGKKRFSPRPRSSWAEKALTEWRGYREPSDPNARLVGVRAALSVLLPKLGLGDAMDEQAVRRAWEKIVGSFVAAQSVPDRIRNGVLFVRVHQSSVRFELERTWKAEIVRKLRAEFDVSKIREVKFFG